MIERLISRTDLSQSEAEASLDFLLNDPNEALISAFLVLLRAKGEAFEEVSSPLLFDETLYFNWYIFTKASPTYEIDWLDLSQR